MIMSFPACYRSREGPVTLHDDPITHKDVSQSGRLASAGHTRPGCQPELLLRSVLDSLCVPLALLDDDSRIVATNKTWRRFVRSHDSMIALGRVGECFRDVCRATIGKGLPPKSWRELDLVLAGERKCFECTACLSKSGASDDFRVRVTRLSSDARRGSIVTIEGVSKPAGAAQSTSELEQRDLEIRAEERRRFATELHDSVGQYLVSLELLLSRLRIDIALPQRASGLVQEMSGVLREAQAEIRTLSYLLSPPWIDYEGGLERAIRAFVEAFAKRAGLKADIHVHGPLFELDQSRQLTLLRIVQEALVNVHRHANAEVVAVKLVNRGASITLQVTDDGTGFSDLKGDTSGHGAGLMGMRARIKHFGGEFHIGTGVTGTTLTATLPNN